MFMLMESALCKLEVLEPIYPLEIVRQMRDQRGMLVQTPVSIMTQRDVSTDTREHDDTVEIRDSGNPQEDRL
jgi:hypothetical protein